MSDDADKLKPPFKQKIKREVTSTASPSKYENHSEQNDSRRRREIEYDDEYEGRLKLLREERHQHLCG